MSEQRVASVERALTILDAFLPGDTELSLAELARRTGLYRSTILRLCASLLRFGYLHRVPNGNFRLGSALLRLGNIYQAGFDLTAYVRPVLVDLVRETGETAAFYVREGERRVCLCRENAPNQFTARIEEGSEMPLDRGASAHVLLAYTDGPAAAHNDVYANGYAISHGERDASMTAISVPVFRSTQAFVGALGVTMQRQTYNDDKGQVVLRVLREQAAALGGALGHAPVGSQQPQP